MKKLLLPCCLFFVFALLSGCSAIKTTVIERKPSPDNKHTAVLFQKDGGATTDFNRQVAVFRGNKKRIPKANAFVMTGTDAEIEWISENCLEIRYSGKVIFKSEEACGVKIRYGDVK